MMSEENKIIRCGFCKKPLEINIINAREFSFCIECEECGFALESFPPEKRVFDNKKIPTLPQYRKFTYERQVEALKKLGFEVDEEGYASW